MPRDPHNDELPPEQMLQSLFRLYQRMLLGVGDPAPGEWADLSDDAMAAWASGFSEMLRLVTEPNEELTYDNVAANANLRFQETLVDGHEISAVVAWDTIEPRVRLMWQAMVRHLANLLALDPEEDGDPKTHEEQMGLWFETKLRALDLPESAQEALAEQNKQARQTL